MHFSKIVTAAAAVFSAGVEGYLQTVGIPKTIKAGDVWDAEVTTAIQQPRQELMVWGMTAYDYEYNNFPQPGSVGNIFAKTNLLETLHNTYNDTIPNLSIPRGTTAGEYAIQAVILEWRGVYNTPELETWFWNVTVGDATSEERVYSSARGENSKGCTVS